MSTTEAFLLGVNVGLGFALVFTLNARRILRNRKG